VGAFLLAVPVALWLAWLLGWHGSSGAVSRFLVDSQPAVEDDARMSDADRFKLLFGPYATPVFKYGDDGFCEAAASDARLAGRRPTAPARLLTLLTAF
jgi:hypothetical protein